MASIRKKRVFIGSSSETKELAHRIKREIEGSCNCSVWYDNFFELGNYVYNDLIQKAVSYDYAILIGGPDDKVIRLKTLDEKLSPRDNIYLEYGMFSGILSTNRILFLIHENCRVASDLTGMTLVQYSDDASAVEQSGQWIRSALAGARIKPFSALDIELLPTVGISVGYFYNFVLPFLEILRTATSFTFNGETYPVMHKKLIISIPTYIEGGDINRYRYALMETEQLEEAILKYRILVDPEALHRGELIVHDIPTTLLAVFKTVDYIFGLQDHETEDSLHAKYRALDNFYDNLPRLLERSRYLSRYVEFRRYDGPEL
ncbi:MAG: nucleotide-binding protein [Oscillospiraceae bacterium]|nr:nucleotide-binding protein [Oscillospiraceae bacterium]